MSGAAPEPGLSVSELEYFLKPGSHLRHNDITGRSRKRKKCFVLMFYVSSVNNKS